MSSNDKSMLNETIKSGDLVGAFRNGDSPSGDRMQHEDAQAMAADRICWTVKNPTGNQTKNTYEQKTKSRLVQEE